MKPTKRKICETGLDMFIKNGYSNVHVDDICEKCGITKTSFYYHLNSKEEILGYFYYMLDEQLVDTFKGYDQYDKNENYWSLIKKVLYTAMDLTEKLGPEVFGKVLTNNLRNNEEVLKLISEQNKILAFFIEGARRNGEIKNKNPIEEIYKAIHYSYMGIETMWCIYGESFDHKKEITNSLENILDVPT